MIKSMNSIKIFALCLLLFLFILTVSPYAMDNVITLTLDNINYSINIPEGWTIKDNGDYSEFLRGDKALGGYYTAVDSEVLTEYKLEEISTAVGRIGIYRTTGKEEDNKLYAVFSQNSNRPAIFLYTSEDTLERDKFMLKMLLINIKAQD